MSTLIFFYISLTVHLGIILVNNQLDALFSMCLFIPFSTCFEQPSAYHQENRVVLTKRHNTTQLYITGYNIL